MCMLSGTWGARRVLRRICTGTAAQRLRFVAARSRGLVGLAARRLVCGGHLVGEENA